MNKIHFRSEVLFLCLFFISFSWLFPCQTAGEEKDNKGPRPAVLAGTWYPGTKSTLTKTIQGYLSKARAPSLAGPLKALIVPHAGYRYSGGVAAHAYKLLETRRFKRVILVGPSHRMSFKGVSVNLQSAYETPLGTVPVDQETAEKLLAAGPDIRWIKQAHAREHSLEIQLPFLQTVLHDFKIVPILMGQQDLDTCLKLSQALVQVMGNSKDTLLLASSDLSHFHTYSRAKEMDQKFIRHIQTLDPQALSKDLDSGGCEACGRGPVITSLLAAKALGADRSVVLNYANSGDVTGDHSRVVGYLSAAFVKSSDKGPHQ
ncbi:MAG: AmmeMemoRadiSam system protein B [Desulfobacterales bacterium]|nr:AmmeMemoRadiSam system protein B [Desulfobacterales bacterium]